MDNEQTEDEKLLFRVMMDLQSYFIAMGERDFADMKRMEHNLRQHVLRYRTLLEERAQQANEDASNGD